MRKILCRRMMVSLKGVGRRPSTEEAEVKAGEGHLRKDKVPPLSSARLHAGLQFKFRANVQTLKK